MSLSIGNVYDPACPARQALDLVADRWTVLVLGVLGDRRLRHTEIARAIPGISPKMLTQTLRSVERSGLVTRTVHAEVPPRVEYEVTPLGASLGSALSALVDWAQVNVTAVQEAREAYDRRVVA